MPLLETAQGEPSALQLLPAAVTVEAGSKVTGNNERDSWALNEHGVLCKGLGTDVGISENQAYAELVLKSPKSVQTSPNWGPQMGKGQTVF